MRGREWTLVVQDFSKGPSIKLPRGFSFMLLLDNVREFIVGYDLFISIITNGDKELDVLVV
jgi:hypothetical protein